MLKNYKARWGHPGKSAIGNVSFSASTDAIAKRKADKIADQLGLPCTPRTLSRGNQIIEVLTTGRTHPRTYPRTHVCTQ